MKNLIAALIAALLVLSSTAALADYDQEIMFQNIPWGTNAEDTAALLLENGFLTEAWSSVSQRNGRIFAPDDTMKIWNVMEKTDYSAIVSYASVSGSNLSNGKIAGYNVQSVEWSFVNDGNQNGLISAQVALEVPDAQAACKDLTEKLTNVYGKKGDYADFFGVMTNTIWYGADDTAVLLINANGIILLAYCKIADTNVLDEYKAVILNSIDTNDVGGL